MPLGRYGVFIAQGVEAAEAALEFGDGKKTALLSCRSERREPALLSSPSARPDRVGIPHGDHADRTHEPAKAFLARKREESKSQREAPGCLKRHLARTVWRTLRAVKTRREAMPGDTTTSTQPALALASRHRSNV